MLLKCIKAENMKLKHSSIWAACIVVPVIPAIMGTFNYLNNLGLLKSEWYSLWTQITLFYSWMFFAPLLGLYCSYLWRLEHLNSNWNLLMTSPVPVRDLYLAKLAVIFRVIVSTQIWLAVLYLICGKLCGFPGMMPADVIFWLLRGTLAAVVTGALQLFLSMAIRSFAVPVGLALGGSILGFLVAGKGWGVCWPYSLLILAMNANQESDVLKGQYPVFAVGIVLFFLLFSALNILWLKKRDV